MSRLTLFLENFLVYGLSGVIGKMIPFFMLPVIARLMPDSYYMGLSDMSSTILSFAQAVAVMGMYDGMFRMFFDCEDPAFKKEICSSALGFTTVSSFIVFLVLLLFRKGIAAHILGGENLAGLVTVTAFAVLSGATNSIAAAPTRMQNKRKVYFFTNLFTPLASYSAAVILLVRGEYVYALPAGSLIAAVLAEMIFICLNRKWFSLKAVRWVRIKAMLAVGLPLMPNFLIYWVFNSCDRLMTAKLLGMDAAGIYAVGAKFGHISLLIYSAFAGGWQYFAFATMRDRDQVELTSKIFEYLGVLAMISTILLSLACGPFFGVLYGETYQPAAITVPYLFMAPLTQMLFQISANQFVVIKKTWPSSLTLACGAVVNVLLNAVLIPVIGIEGAAVATLAGFAVSVLVCAAVLEKMGLFRLYPRCRASILLFFAYMAGWRAFYGRSLLIQSGFALMACLLYMWMYRRELGKMFAFFCKKR